MDDKIIERLLEVNEQRSKSADKNFLIVSIILFFSIIGNIYQASMKGEIVVEQSNESADYNMNGNFK